MATPAQRFQGWIDSLAVSWKDRLREWMASWVMKGFEAFLEDIEPDSIVDAKATIDKIKANPNTPPEVIAYLERFQGGGFNPLIILGVIMAIGTVIQAINAIWLPGNRQMNYAEERKAQTFRLDPISVISAWRRDPEKYAILFNDLRDQGWSENRLEALKFFTMFYPPPADLVRWQAREVFEPEMIKKYGLDDELGGIERSPFYKAGMNDEQITNYWRAHWEHASWVQVVEMLYRGEVTEQDVYDWFRLVEIVPFWRDKLIKIAYAWPTRVDVRRWWDMGTIDEARLRELYQGMGYRGKNLDDYVLWTKVYVAFPTLMARWKNGWITEQDVRSELTRLGMPDSRVNTMIQEQRKAVEAGQVEEGKALTKTEIYKGVKTGKITRDEGIDLLMDLNYNYSQAEYLLDINVSALEGSPETYDEFKDITTKYKLAIGKEAKPMPEELVKIGQEVIRLTKEAEALRQAIKEEKDKHLDAEVLPDTATRKLRKLEVALHRAEAELERMRTDYDIKVAEWKHGAG